jgi:cell division protein FtsQ
MPPDVDAEARRKRRKRLAALVVLVGVFVLVSPLWLRQLDYFRVRRIEVIGARYVQPGALLERLAIDSSVTIWHSLKPLVARVREHPQVRDVSISRRLPGTLELRIVENLPVALVATSKGLEPFDRDGNPLPIDPSQTPVDLPVLAQQDTLVLRMLDGIRVANPALFARISDIRWDDRGGLRVLLSGVIVRAAPDCSWERFSEIVAVEQDLARRGQRALELDLRYRDQVVARIE